MPSICAKPQFKQVVHEQQQARMHPSHGQHDCLDLCEEERHRNLHAHCGWGPAVQRLGGGQAGGDRRCSALHLIAISTGPLN